jgi:transcription initiation factor IIE alpha subunit
MSGDAKVNDSPNHFIVLDAIGRGLKSTDKISKVTRLDKSEVELILNDLTVQRLVVRMVKKGFFRNKTEFVINETGQSLLDSKKRELERKAKDIQQAYGNGNQFFM